jgi:hypothetical protein
MSLRPAIKPEWGVKMNTKPKLRLLIARVLIATTTNACLAPHAGASMISTESAVAGDRARILVLLDRPNISAQLEARGVRPTDAKARVATLSDDEIAQLSAGIDKARAGAGGDGAVWAVFLLLLLPLVLVVLAVSGVVKIAKLASAASESK